MDLSLIGKANYVTRRRFSSAIEATARKLERFDGYGSNGPYPEDDLRLLRERYLDERAFREYLDRERNPPNAYLTLAENVIKAAYRLTVFAAAVVILARAF